MTAALSPSGLARLHDRMAAHVSSGEMPGLALLVARGDEVHVETIGAPAFGAASRLDRSAIFRIASLTKPVTAVAAMTLVDEGVLALDQPVDRLLPELAGRRVLRSIDASLDDTVPAARPITVEDLLSYRMGFGSIMAPPGTYPIQRAEEAVRLQSIGGPPWPPTTHTPDSWMAALGSLPLMYQPGAQWLYGTSGQVLGVLVARAAGRDVGTVFRERIFSPLGMADTGFTVPAGDLGRLVTAYAPDPASGGGGGGLAVLDDPRASWWATPPSFPDCAGWLVSTIDDYWAFARMLARGGDPILSPASVALLTADRLTAAQRAASTVFLGEHGGWGLGLATPAAGSTAPLPYGYGWEGGTGTSWRTHPASGVTGILFTQRAVTSPEMPPPMRDFWAGVNDAAGL